MGRFTNSRRRANRQLPLRRRGTRRNGVVRMYLLGGARTFLSAATSECQRAAIPGRVLRSSLLRRGMSALRAERISANIRQISNVLDGQSYGFRVEGSDLRRLDQR